MLEAIRNLWPKWDGKGAFPKLDMGGLLREALTKEGVISEAFSVFHNYSIANTIQVLYQCAVLGIDPGPMASESKWKELGRTILPEFARRKLWIWIPKVITKETDNGEKERVFIGRFLYRPVVAVLSMTEGEEFVMPDPPKFSLPKALEELNFKMKPFDELNGNIGGYATGDGELAVNPLSEDPFAVAIHEIAHNILHSKQDKLDISRALREVEAEATTYLVCHAVEAMDEAMASRSRGYIQGWAKRYGKQLTEETAQRIFGAVNQILKAGT